MCSSMYTRVLKGKLAVGYGTHEKCKMHTVR